MSFESGKKKKKSYPDCFLPRSPLTKNNSFSEITIKRYMCKKGPIQAQKSKQNKPPSLDFSKVVLEKQWVRQTLRSGNY